MARKETIAAIQPVGMQELVLEADDLDRTVRFYEDVIGLRMIARWGDDRPAVWFDGGEGLALGVWSKQAAIGAIHDGRGGAHVHFALRLPPGTIDQVQQRFEAHGQDVTRIAFEHGGQSVYITDPDGNCVEFMERPVDERGNPKPFTYGGMRGGEERDEDSGTDN